MFTLPNKLSDIEDLESLRSDALKAYQELAKIDDADLTDEQLTDLESLAAAVEAIDAEAGQRQTAADARAERIAKAKAPLDADKGEEDPEEEPEVEADPEVEPEIEEPLDVEIPDDAREITEKETVTASAAPRKSVARRVAGNAPTPKLPAKAARPSATITASADIKGFAAGQELDMDGVVEAFTARLGAMPKRRIKGAVQARHTVANFQKAVAPEFHLERGNSEGNFEKIMASIKAQSGEAKQSLVAAGGWCAPSETIYDIPSLETVNGILSLPEVTFTRGGINFTKGPDFSQIYADSGFLQTETQAEAGELKNFIDVECPGFTEVRLDAIGYGIRAGILTNAAWPELVRRYVEGVLVAHAHKVNAYKINKIVAAAGAQITATGFGSAVADTLAALAQQAMRLRYKYRMAIDARVEGFAPMWLFEVLRQDLAYQNGVDTKAITNQQVDGWLAARNIYLQWVFDFQDLGPTGTAYPTSVNVVMYPTGTYVVGTSDVISLDAVYDTAGLEENTFTAAFFEEGIAVFNPVANGVNVRIPLVAVGRSGARDITAAVPTLV